MDIDPNIDTIDSVSPTPSTEELLEKDFIQENYKKSPKPFWMLLAIFSALVVLFWGVGSWYYRVMEVRFENKPFLQVTNREMSIFLWQFPEYLPQHVQNKTGYLPGFHREKLGIIVESADEYAQAPPDLLFLYHTWARLLKEYLFPRPILKSEFIEFLEQLPEWNPLYWREAPTAYRQMVQGIRSRGDNNLESLSLEALPIIVRQAFQGWKNYRFEGDEINAFSVKYQKLKDFLLRYGHYERNFWRNPLDATYPRYLWSYTFGEVQDDDVVPKNEMAPFLRFALFNALNSA